MKTCASGQPCQHRTTNETSVEYGCNYSGYCDYQLPRDSRPLQWGFPDYKMPEQTCSYCHLPLSKCKGHTICSTKETYQE